MQLPRMSPVVSHLDLVNIGKEARTSLFGQTINEVTPLIGGTADHGCIVLISIGGAVFGTTATDAGEWSLDTRIEVPLSGRFDLASDGCKKLVVTAIDTNGRSRVIEGVFTVSTASPEPPTLVTDRLFRHALLLKGHAEPGSIVSVTFAGATFVAVAESGGEWRLDMASQKAVSGRLDLGDDGRKDVDLVCTDLAGNMSKGRCRLVLRTGETRLHRADAVMHRSSIYAVGSLVPTDAGRVWLGASLSRCGGTERT